MYSPNFSQFSCHYASSTGSSSDSQVETDPTYMLRQPTSSVVNMPLATYATEHMCWLQPFEYFPATFFPPEYVLTSVNMNHTGDSNQWDCPPIHTNLSHTLYIPVKMTRPTASTPLKSTIDLCPDTADLAIMNGNEFDTSEFAHNTKGSSTSDEVRKTNKPSSKERKSGQSEGESTSNQRQVYVLKACKSCKAAHVACDIQRPCQRCRRTGNEDTCEDAARKKRGRPPLAKNENRRKYHRKRTKRENSSCPQINKPPSKPPQTSHYQASWFLNRQSPSISKQDCVGHKDIQPRCSVHSPQPGPFTNDHTLNQVRDINTIAQDKTSAIGHVARPSAFNPMEPSKVSKHVQSLMGSSRVNQLHDVGNQALRWKRSSVGQSEPPLNYFAPTPRWTSISQ